jgi:zinc transport system ATP-binding protein
MQNIDHTENFIEIHNVSYAYDGIHDVLKNISFNIHKGDYLGIVGPNGGGKTTLLKLILGLLVPTSGFIHTIQYPNGYVAQKTINFDSHFPITVREVVSQGRIGKRGLFHSLLKEDWRRVDEALELVDLSDYKHRLVADLSGGQQQRVFIARALTGAQPHILILDEPTAGIDVNSQERFYTLLKKLNQELDMTIILVSHDIDIITNEVTEIAVINQKLVYYGDAKKFTKTHYLLHNH